MTARLKVTLTAQERRQLHAGVCGRHADTVPGVYVCGPCESAGDRAVEEIVASRLALAADACCTCHVADAPHEDWCVSVGILAMLVDERSVEVTWTVETRSRRGGKTSEAAEALERAVLQLAQAEAARIEQACETALQQGRGVRVVTHEGFTTVEVTAEVPFGTIHRYPRGRDGGASS
ncbi:MAG TPA: hypothetical protein VMF51_18135 [Nocardioides sp.]|uniref:hypothetical protein n=1 Tax=Nocardioides sp. TaxID=35761 RepID=UPI002B81E1EB|nr:hypothetical protein [Nocardioides sp.]HTW17055.1 hypothetical protein [Nocardioides sp.]